MKTVLRFVKEGIGLAVLVLLGIVFLFLVFRTIPASNTAETLSGGEVQSAYPPPPYPPPGQQPTVESVAQPPYPPPESVLQTPIGPKPTSTTEPTPTITPVPTSLPLPSSSYYALWAENFPEGQGSVLWLADPGNIGNRREVLRFERDAIAEVSLAPDGSRLALVTKYWKESVLWLAKMDGSDLHQLGPAMGAGGELFWSRNSQSLEDGVILTSLNTGEKRQMFEQQMFDPNTSLRALGYSADGQELYYLVGIPQEIDYKYEIWAVGQDGRGAHKLLAFDQNPGLPILSPDGSKFLIGTAEGMAWISTDGQTQLLSSWKQRCGLIWSTRPDEVIHCQVDEQQPIEYISAVHIPSGITQELAVIALPDGKPYGPLAISPDHQWLVTAQYGNSSLYWIHLASGTIVPVPTPNKGSLRFISWLPAQP
jgi:hypothetical protein